MQTYTKEAIQALLLKNNMAVIKGIEAIYARQTSDERASQTTAHSNGRGFNGRDAKFGSSLAIQIKEWHTAEPATRYPFPLSTRAGGQLDCARRLIFKYAGQLADVANEKAAAELAAERAAIQAEADEFETPVVGEPWSADQEADFDEFEDSHLSLA